LEQRLVGRKRNLGGLAVDAQADAALPRHCLDPKQISSATLHPFPVAVSTTARRRAARYSCRLFSQGDRQWRYGSATPPPISRPRPPRARSTSTTGSATSG